MIAGVPYDAEVEYLESTGTQWIDTGFDPSSKQVKIALDFQIVNTGYNQFNWCTGFQYSATFVGAYPDTSSDVFYQARYTYSQNADKYAKTKAVYNGTHPDTNGAGSLLIFARRALDGSVPQPGGSKHIFGLSIIYSGVLVTDMIPVRVGSIGYMYDRVSRKLFGNAGTGAFVLGPDVATPVMGLRKYPQSRLGKIGARRMMKSLSARDYVQDGLVAMWDGIENAGWGTHDASTTVWKDLVGSNDFTLQNGIEVRSNYIYTPQAGIPTTNLLPSIGNVGTVEFVGYASTVDNHWAIMNISAEQYVFRSYRGGLVWCNGRSGNLKPSIGAWDLSSKAHSFVCGSGTNVFTKMYEDGVDATDISATTDWWVSAVGLGINWGYNLEGLRCQANSCYCVRLYSRSLTASEIAANYAVDKLRFNLP